MKILFYTCSLQKGGAERILTSLANTLSKKNDVSIVTNVLDTVEYPISKNINYTCLDEIKIKNIFMKIRYKLSRKRTRKLQEKIEIQKPDIVFSFLPEPSIRLLQVKRKVKNVKAIVCVRNHPKYEFKFCKILRNYYYKYADKIVVQSAIYKQYFPKKLQSKILVIPNFLTDDFLLENHSPTCKKIVTVARLEKQKNVSLLIKAYKDLKRYDYPLYIYGEGKRRKKIEKQIKKYHLEDKIILKGKVDNIRKEIEDASLFVLSSNYEGFPNVIIEAISLKIPVVVTNSTEVMYEIVNSRNGKIVSKKNKQELKKTIELSLLKQYSDLEKESILIKEKYNKEKIIEKWQALIKR